MQSEELTLFKDMARRAFEAEIQPYYTQWEEDKWVPRSLWNTLGEAAYCALTSARNTAALARDQK